MHHFIASLAILFFKTYSAHGLVTFWKILVRARRYSTMSSSRVKCTTLQCCMKYDVGNVVSGAHCIKNICRKYMEKLIHVENGMVNWIVLR